MRIKTIIFSVFVIALMSCNSNNEVKIGNYPDVKVASAMKNVMRKGELGGKIKLDTISDKIGLYGLGPVQGLTGELLINNGESYVSKVISDSTMSVEKSFDVSAPFFVYANVTEWSEVNLPASVKSIKDLEEFIDKSTNDYKRPFAFKLAGKVSKAIIHIQNLPPGTKVSSPKEAHQGQVKYDLTNEESEIIGMFSTEHKGIFTHHDTFLHMHLITKDESKMGHLDELEIDNMKLYLPAK